ncbi:MAG: hypothetical protein A2Y73_02415 [Chloroflexi bacterium RBG_13_56_8]|nr:MAG: hypothetical protein A2Y73_02415 [Chloroflexi bacterium RBG_13_56_8]
MSSANVNLQSKALCVQARLIKHYGEPVRKVRRDPLSELILTVLSQNTADVNTSRAYDSLRERFPTWQDVLDAPVEEVAEAIHIGGLSQIKAPRIQRILQELADQWGSLNMDFLQALPTDEARKYLTSFRGVGPKTAACVLLFSLNKPALPVDTHVLRVARRLGLIPEKVSAEKANILLEDLLPEEAYYPFHLIVIQHGRTICHARSPRCEICPVAQDCDYYATLIEGGSEEKPTE